MDETDDHGPLKPGSVAAYLASKDSPEDRDSSEERNAYLNAVTLECQSCSEPVPKGKEHVLRQCGHIWHQDCIVALFERPGPKRPKCCLDEEVPFGEVKYCFAESSIEDLKKNGVIRDEPKQKAKAEKEPELPPWQEKPFRRCPDCKAVVERGAETGGWSIV